MSRLLPTTFLLLSACAIGAKGGDVVVAPCDLAATGAVPAEEELPAGLVEGLATYDGLAGAWTVDLACADGSDATATLTLAASERDAFTLETWEGAGCDATAVARADTHVALADWTHTLDARLDTSVHEDGAVRISGGSSPELELGAWEDEIHGTVRVPWPASAKDVASESDEDPMDCTFEGWSPAGA